MADDCEHVFAGPPAHRGILWDRRLSRSVPRGEGSPRCLKCGMSKLFHGWLEERRAMRLVIDGPL